MTNKKLVLPRVRSLVAGELEGRLSRWRKQYPETYENLWDYFAELLKIARCGNESWICNEAFHKAREIMLEYGLLGVAELRQVIGSAIERSR